MKISEIRHILLLSPILWHMYSQHEINQIGLFINLSTVQGFFIKWLTYPQSTTSFSPPAKLL